ncbi:flagellar biosynthesis protein FlhB [Rhizobium oryzicola]|uniref:Flagellar biosynthetic protein FlhB n=1 Tax=Rhizobium oryzicola TaxID=1232668 RepID=A0ABT8SSF2_9HYPH|nr:flagellar biosynthesis protein FlhB [Rhizobium oryzicola]MDO1580999.1 flagellar biosynthesis protein FlhB [Rhizobium oryzicola]
MSEEQDSKTEDPSGKKLKDAADKGNVPFSREVTLFASSLAFYFYLVFFLPGRTSQISERLKDFFEQTDQWPLNNATDVVSISYRLGWEMAAFLLPAMLLFCIFGVTSSIVQNMPSAVLERVRPQFDRVSLSKGFSRIFSVQGAIEFGKSIFKLLIVGICMYFAMRADFLHSLDAMFADPLLIPNMLYNGVKKMMIIIILATAVLAVADFFWTRHHWFSQLKMTKQEVKDENKQAQGDPVVKSRQRSLMRSRARQRMINNVPRATLVIANPTHYAVALRYVREESDAPIVVAKGSDLIALKIREIAEANDIPVFEDPPLARSMFAQVSVDSVIPPAFYKAVAELIHRIYASRAAKKRVR